MSSNSPAQWDHPPRSMNELLQLSLKLSEQESRELAPTQFTEMDPERRAFLEGALGQFQTQDDEAKELKTCIDFMQPFVDNVDQITISDEHLEELSDKFDRIGDLVECTENANDFGKMGGLEVCVLLLKSPYSSLQWKAADCIATCCQNNPVCQSVAVRLHAITSLIYVLENIDIDIVSIKCMFALSQIVGSFPPAIVMFMQLDGLRTVIYGVASNKVKLRIKSATLLFKLIACSPEEPEEAAAQASDTAPKKEKKKEKETEKVASTPDTAADTLKLADSSFILSELVQRKVHVALIRSLKQKLDNSHVILIRLLAAMVERSKEVVYEIKKEHTLKRLFADRCRSMSEKDAEAHEEEIENYSRISGICFPES